MNLKAIKKRILSKTYHVAGAMMSVGIVVEQYAPEIKQVISDKIGVSWGIAYAVVFGIAMQIMREITKEPISQKGERDVYDNGQSKNGSDGGNGLDDSSYWAMDRVSGAIDDPAAESGFGVVQGKNTGKRIADPSTKRRRRAKRRK